MNKERIVPVNLRDPQSVLFIPNKEELTKILQKIIKHMLYRGDNANTLQIKKDSSGKYYLYCKNYLKASGVRGYIFGDRYYNTGTALAIADKHLIRMDNSLTTCYVERDKRLFVARTLEPIYNPKRDYTFYLSDYYLHVTDFLSLEIDPLMYQRTREIAEELLNKGDN